VGYNAHENEPAILSKVRIWRMRRYWTCPQLGANTLIMGPWVCELNLTQFMGSEPEGLHSKKNEERDGVQWNAWRKTSDSSDQENL